ncbi:MAG: biotin--[acetyl-CoA-carboxylase] ligase [Chitinophagales bacterium]
MVYNTLFVGKVRIHLDKIDSTNKYATQLLKNEGVREGTIISTAHQFAGKGQRGNTWESEVGQNITLSLILYPHFILAYQQFLLSQSISLAIQSFATEILGEGVCIKWPNDIYYRDKKITGILIENSLSGKSISSSIVGIGINVNQAYFSPFLQYATSFHQITNKIYNLPSLIQQLAHHIEARYFQLKAMRFDLIQRNYLSKLYRFNEWHSFEDMATNILFEGKIVDVQKDGKLVIEVKGTMDGFGNKRRVFGLKEVKFVL